MFLILVVHFLDTFFPSALLLWVPGLILLFCLGISLSFLGAWILHGAYTAFTRRLNRLPVRV